MTDVLELPFDQYQRYGLVRELLESVRAPGRKFHILDVGGRTALLREFLPQDRVDLVDVDPSDAEGLVLGSGAQLPFADGSVDVVAAFDTLEHVPPPLREAFVAECARVAREYVILAGPYDAPRVAEAEEILLQFLRDRLDWEHRYLAEHRENGLPDAAATIEGLSVKGGRVETIGHGELDRWLLLMMLELYVEHESLLRDVAKRAYRLYNEAIFRSDHGDEVYRHAIVAAYGDAPMPTIEKAFEPRGSAPVEASAALVELGREVMRYDSLRETYEPEMKRLHEQVASANKDRDEHRESMETMRADVVAHDETIAALRKELSDERESVQGVLADRDERIGGLETDLEGHKATIAELESLRASELAELEVRGKRINELEHEQHAVNQRANELEERLTHLERVHGEHLARHGELEQHHAELVERHAELERRHEEVIALTRDAARDLERVIGSVDEKAPKDIAESLRSVFLDKEAQLEFVRERQRKLVEELKRPWSRLGRVVTMRRFDPDWRDDGAGVSGG